MSDEAGLKLKDLFVFLAVIIAVWFLLKIPTVLLIFGIGFLLFFVIDPLIDRLEKFWPQRTFWVSMVCLFLLALLVISFMVLVPVLFAQLKEFIKYIPVYIDSLNGLLKAASDYVGSREISGATFKISFESYFDSALQQLNFWASNSLQNSFSVGLALFSNIFIKKPAH